MAGWLDGTTAAGVIGAELMGDVDSAVFAVHVEAARTYVESRRPELFEVADAVPAQHIVVGASMLALRTYKARTTSAAEVVASTDLAAMLGVGRNRRFGFGGAGPVAEPVVEVP